ncbi:hypothetical protein K3495_g1262 [Podosphaera aphanis]|nr:hypothetical protein K3495_g1262 [Podosphaera aphanis]
MWLVCNVGVERVPSFIHVGNGGLAVHVTNRLASTTTSTGREFRTSDTRTRESIEITVARAIPHAVLTTFNAAAAATNGHPQAIHDTSSTEIQDQGWRPEWINQRPPQTREEEDHLNAASHLVSLSIHSPNSQHPHHTSHQTASNQISTPLASPIACVGHLH